MLLNRLPTELLKELQAKDLVLLPELNYLGQLSHVLRAQGVNAHSVSATFTCPSDAVAAACVSCSPQSGIQHISHDIAEHVEGEHDYGDREAWENRHPRGALHVEASRPAEHLPP